MAVSIVTVVILLMATHTPYQTYFSGAQFIHFLLGPTTVALAVPLYDLRIQLAKNWLPILLGLFAGAVRGGVAMLMSLSGGLLSTLVMGLLFRWKNQSVSLLAVGVAGAITHNLAQLAIAALLTGPAVISYLPFLLLYALVTGSVTGSALKILLPALKKVTRLGK